MRGSARASLRPWVPAEGAEGERSECGGQGAGGHVRPRPARAASSWAVAGFLPTLLGVAGLRCVSGLLLSLGAWQGLSRPP